MAASIAATAGNSQSTSVSTAFATALQATVKDSFSNPVNGATVTFTAPGTGASGSFSTGTTATAMTNASGVATAPTLTANSQMGGYSVTASVTGAGTPASFSLTNTAAAVRRIAARQRDQCDDGGEPDDGGNRRLGALGRRHFEPEGGSDPATEQLHVDRPGHSGGLQQRSAQCELDRRDSDSKQRRRRQRPVYRRDRPGLLVHGSGGHDLADLGGARGRLSSGGTLTAVLSDGSAPNFTNTTATAGGQYDRNYTLTYQAAQLERADRDLDDGFGHWQRDVGCGGAARRWRTGREHHRYRQRRHFAEHDREHGVYYAAAGDRDQRRAIRLAEPR